MNVARRAIGAVALGMLLSGLWIAPASAHSELIASDPGPGTTEKDAPETVTLSFTEGVQSARDAIRVLDDRGQGVSGVGKTYHPAAKSELLAASLPQMERGTYIVTWRASSTDSHPIRGSFTFSIGAPSASNAEAESVSNRLLSAEGGDRNVRIIVAVVRATTFIGILLLIGSTFFAVGVWAAGRDDRRARRLVWAAWVIALVSTLFGYVLQGPYVDGTGLGGVADPNLWSDVFATRFGETTLVRAVLLLLAVPLLRVLFRKDVMDEARQMPKWWLASAFALGVFLLATPGLAGHASTGIMVPLALVLDTIHLGAVGVWLGGLAMLLVTLANRDDRTLGVVAPRFSRVAMFAILAIIFTGLAQALRQVGAVSDLVDTDYGRLLSVKVILVLGIVLVGTVSRDVINRRWLLLVATDGDGASQPHQELPDGYELDAPTAQRRLRSSVWTEVAISAVVLVVTALLVNSPPPKKVSSEPFFANLVAETIEIETTLAPASRGKNDLHLTALSDNGVPVDVKEMSAEMSLPKKDIAPFDVALLRAGVGHYISRGLTVPFEGDWKLTVNALVSEVDSQKASVTIPIG